MLSTNHKWSPVVFLVKQNICVLENAGVCFESLLLLFVCEVGNYLWYPSWGQNNILYCLGLLASSTKLSDVRPRTRKCARSDNLLK